jgi:hypothetical protein
MTDTCWYYSTDRLKRYTGYWQCTLNDSIYYCDVCYANSNKVRDYGNWEDEFNDRQSVASIIEDERAKFSETKAEQKARAANQHEWRELDVPNLICSVVGCLNEAKYHLRGTEHMMCQLHFTKAVDGSL